MDEEDAGIGEAGSVLLGPVFGTVLIGLESRVRSIISVGPAAVIETRQQWDRTKDNEVGEQTHSRLAACQKLWDYVMVYADSECPYSQRARADITISASTGGEGSKSLDTIMECS